MADALKNYEAPQGDWLKKLPAKIRILETDPLTYVDGKFASTHFVFRVFNYDDKKVQILDKSTGVMNRIAQLHQDKDYGANITKLDIKISSTGSGIETRYSLDPLPNSLKWSEQQIDKALAEVDLEELYADKNAMRLSAAQSGDDSSTDIPGTHSKRGSISDSGDVVPEDVPEEAIDLSEIPF